MKMGFQTSGFGACPEYFGDKGVPKQRRQAMADSRLYDFMTFDYFSREVVPMAREVNIMTPEHVELHFELAGIGSRFIAVLLDTLLQGLVTLLIVIMFSIGGVPWFERSVTARYRGDGASYNCIIRH